ncbi:unnamed protein product, partial [Didymodactylos carnosus]
VTIKIPQNDHIYERTRQDTSSIFPAFKYYIVPREHLSIENVDLKTITLQLKTRLTTDLVGRYTCTERINNILEENAIYVFIYDGKSIFTKSSYSSVMKQTGVHFFNIPCQTTNWFTKMNCPVPNNDQCIPVYYTPEFQAQRSSFEVQLSVNNFENQFYEYSLVINNVTFEDEEELTISVKSKILNKKTIKPIVDGDPVAYFSFIPEQIPHSLKWRDDFRNEKIYPYGVFENEIYRVMCSVHHRSDTEKPLNVFILKRTCLLDDCLHNLIDTKSCGDTRKGWTKMNVDSYALDKFRTQFTSIERETVTDPDVGHQYLCCYKNSLMSKGLTAMANDRSMFVTKKPEFSMVTGDILTYGCEAHELIYDEISFVYNDGINTYERKRTDNEWVLAGTTQKKKLDLQWVVDSTRKIHAMIVNVSTSPLTAHDSGFIQCKVTSKRSNIIPDITDTYTINVDDPLPMGFITPLNPNPKLYRSSGADIYLDCNHQGRPQPKVIWLKGQQPVKYDSTITFGPNNGSLKINRLQGSDTGYYTCELNNGRDQSLIRSFDLYVKGTNPDSRYRKFGAILGFIFASLLLLMLTLLVIGAFKYRQMKKKVKASQFTQEKHNRTSQLFDENQQIVKQLKLIALPENFATKNQVKTLLGYVNESHEMDSNDFKKLGEGQFGVVYKVRLPDVGFVAAKMLPESIRNANNRKDKGRKSIETEALNKDQEFAKKQKATEMLIEELKVLGKVGQHFNIVGLISVAYPKTELKSIFSGPIRDEDSFYLMELCENGSLESVLRTFNTHQENNNNLETKPSLYKNLSNTKAGITVERAVNTSSLTDDDLKLMAYQVACGVDYLNRKQIAHSDIAPRNVLVTDRFIMKICDFGLATWTTYKNYSEQLATGRVQLEKKHNSTATHNLTPELATAMLRNSSNGGENLLLNKSSMNADVWSFGIFLWCLFLKCKYRPFNQIHREVQHPSDSEYMSRLLRILSSGRVLEYIDYHPEIPREVYAIIRVCLREETERPEMSNIRSYLCHKQMLSRQAFDYYKNEYNQDKEAHSNGSNVEVFGEVQGGEDLPKFNENHAVDSDGNGRIDMNYRDGSGDDRQQQRKDYGYYVPPSEISNKSTRPLLPHSYRDNSDYDQNDSYLQPTTEPKKFPAHVKGTHNIQNDNELENSSLRKDNIMNKPRNDNDNINVTYNTASNTKRLAPYLRGNNDSYL